MIKCQYSLNYVFKGEEDPSIAIDQFIKKIADEQLSSKRIGTQEEKENDQEKELSEDLVLPPENKELLEEEEVGENTIGDDKISDIPVEEENALPAESDNVLAVPENIESEPPLALLQDTNSLPLESDTLSDDTLMVSTTLNIYYVFFKCKSLQLNEINENAMPVKTEEDTSEVNTEISKNRESEPMDIDDSQLEAHSNDNVLPKSEPAEDMNEDTQESETPSDFMQV